MGAKKIMYLSTFSIIAVSTGQAHKNAGQTELANLGSASA
jgi:hypothetical protein